MSGIEVTTPWRRGVCHVNGIDIHFWRSGGAKPPVVILHGLMGSGACLLPMAQALIDYDVILPDARGHAGSSSPEYGYTYVHLARDVVELVDALSLDHPVLVGHSMGGMTAAVVANTLGASLKAVVLVDPTFISPARQRDVFESDVASEHRRSLLLTREALVDLARQRHPGRPAELIDALVDARLSTSPNAFEVLTPPNPDWRQLSEATRVPTLLIIGDRGIVSPETANELKAANPSVSVELIPGAGHGMPYDLPLFVGARVSAFLAACHSPSA